MSQKDSSHSLSWFLAGLGLGVLLGIFYAPRSGRETRRAIRGSAQEGKEYLKKQGREARESMEDWVERGKDVISRQKEQFGSAFEAGRQAYRETAKAGTQGEDDPPED